MNTSGDVLTENQDSEAEQIFQREGFDLQDVDAMGWTHLHFAAADGRSDLVKILFKLGADKNKENKAFETPFAIAVKNNRKGVVKQFLDQGFDVNRPDSQGKLPIMDVLSHKNSEILAMIVKEKPPLNNQDASGNMPIHVAAKHGFLAGVLLLFEHGVSPHQKGENGETPLQMAIAGGHQAVARMIQDFIKGVNIPQLRSDYSSDVLWQSIKLVTGNLIDQSLYLSFWLFFCPFFYYLFLNEFVIPFELPISSTPYAPSLWQIFLTYKPLALGVFSLPWAKVVYDHVFSTEPLIARDLVISMEIPIALYLILDLIFVRAVPFSVRYFLQYTLVWCLTAMALIGTRCYWASIMKLGK